MTRSVMSTSSLIVYRFPKRYYCFLNSHDSYPSHLGRILVDKIPTDPNKYHHWLSKEKEKAARWHEGYEACLLPYEGIEMLHDDLQLDT